jgi:hypothetical protein
MLCDSNMNLPCCGLLMLSAGRSCYARSVHDVGGLELGKDSVQRVTTGDVRLEHLSVITGTSTSAQSQRVGAPVSQKRRHMATKLAACTCDEPAF